MSSYSCHLFILERCGPPCHVCGVQHHHLDDGTMTSSNYVVSAGEFENPRCNHNPGGHQAKTHFFWGQMNFLWSNCQTNWHSQDDLICMYRFSDIISLLKNAPSSIQMGLVKIKTEKGLQFLSKQRTLILILCTRLKPAKCYYICSPPHKSNSTALPSSAGGD